MPVVKLGNINIGEKGTFLLIAGPCAIESEKSALFHAKAIKMIARELKIPFVFKSSYDKANRTSLSSYRGPGIDKGLEILERVKNELDVFVTSDIHTEREIEKAAKVLDMIQIPAFLSRQTSLLVEAARTGKVVNVKKGQFLSPWDVKYIIDKVHSAGNKKLIITERGASFGYNNLVSDFRSLVIMRDFGVPLIYDASHSVQMPGGLGGKSGGDRRFIKPLMFAAASVGCDGIFVEVHKKPDEGLCDGPNMLDLGHLKQILKKVLAINKLIKSDK